MYNKSSNAFNFSPRELNIYNLLKAGLPDEDIRQAEDMTPFEYERLKTSILRKVHFVKHQKWLQMQTKKEEADA